MPVLGGRWECRERIGESSIAALYRAVDRETGDPVSVRLLHDHLSDRELVRNRFEREVGALDAIDDDHVVRLLATGGTDGARYAITESFQGTNLEGLLAREGRLSERRAVEIARDVLKALDAAHEVGLVHRDVHPRHIWPATERGTVMGGFGMAKVRQIVSLTTHSTAAGRADYAAPERLQPTAVDGRTDLYSLGIVLFEMLAGAVPSRATERVSLANRSSAASDLHDKNPEVSDAVATVVERATRFDAEGRYRTAEMMREALDAERPRSGAHDELDLCPQCATPLLATSDRCLGCGHRPGRVVQRPGEGTWRVVIPKHPKDLLGGSYQEVDDVRWARFLRTLEETGLEPDWLSWRKSKKRKRPIHLADGLTREDATRLRDAFSARDVPVESRDDNDLRSYFETLVEATPLTAQLVGSVPVLVLFATVLVSFFGGFSQSAIGMLLLLTVALAAVTGWLGMQTRRKLVPILALDADDDTEALGIPSEALDAATGAVTAKTRGIWVDFVAAWRELESQVDFSAEDAMNRLMDQAVATVDRMRKLEDQRRAISVVDIVDAIDTIDTRIEHAERASAIERMIERKTTLDQRLETADELDRRIAELREALLDCTSRLRRLAGAPDGDADIALPDLEDELERHRRAVAADEIAVESTHPAPAIHTA